MYAKAMGRLTVVVAVASVLAGAWMGLGAGAARAQFGIEVFDQSIASDPQGDVFSQAGGHPYAISTTVNLDSHPDPQEPNIIVPDADVRDIVVHLPPGLLGNPASAARCTGAQLLEANYVKEGTLPWFPECPVGSQVGVITLHMAAFEASRYLTFPVYNMVPPPTVPAEFGFNALGTPITLDGDVRNGGDFGVTISANEIPVVLPLDGQTITFWGVPGDPKHDSQRCNGLHIMTTGECEVPQVDPEPPIAFLRLPTSCPASGVGLKTTAQVDSWIDPGDWLEGELISHLPPGYPAAPGEWGAQEGTTGCESLPFTPSVAVSPSTAQADTPAGLNIDIALPQEGLLSPTGLGSSDARKMVVTLPAGVAVSPSAAGGLQACSEAQIGLGNGDAPSCPEASKLATVEITTPLLEHGLTGSVFLAKQNENPFHTLLALYLVAEGSGVRLKLPGEVKLDPQTGQLITTFDNIPQLPFEHVRVNFNGGSRAPLVNPHACGTYTTSAQITPWSGTGTVTTTSSFQITSGPGGGPCPSGGSSFAPSFRAGTTNIQAGAFSPFTLAFFRNDGEQQLGELQVKTPPGLLGTLSNVPLCPEPQASTGDCSAASQIGGMIVGAGAGATPVYVHGGKIYLTGSYKGSQFGLSIVQEATAGPFDLGRVVVRGQITVDPHTASLTISSDPLPTSLQGIPLDLRVVSVTIDKPNFTFNPTDCNPMQITGTLTSGQGAAETVASPFQVTDCQALGFKPKFTVSTNGHTSRLGGASLDAKIAYPKGAPQANIAKVKVSLPKQLPSRLTTLQKACPAATFEAGPSHCPAASVVGIARAVTPILPVPLSGPMYFVSHGGEAFPNLIMVLQGYGVRVDLVGTTFISKTGITSSTFGTVPDVPIDSFELYLPQGPGSALAANGNLCKSKLTMPTSFVAQNGMSFNQNTAIKVTGCAKKAARKASGARRARAGTRRRNAPARARGSSTAHRNGRGK
ncbi:MAG TPA: hypothetical protein VGI76_00480 [Solirubrobacteraceae bacterium]|jgi:hypothetical protein